MLNQYSESQLVDELLRRRHRPASVTITSPFRTTRNVLIVTGVVKAPTREQRSEVLGYSSRRSARTVIDFTYDRLHKCVRIVTENSSHGQNFRDDHDWLAGKTTTNPQIVHWTDRDGNTRVRGLLHKVGIEFKTVIAG